MLFKNRFFSLVDYESTDDQVDPIYPLCGLYTSNGSKVEIIRSIQKEWEQQGGKKASTIMATPTSYDSSSSSNKISQHMIQKW